MLTVHHEQLREGFEKFHIQGLPFSAVIHKISSTDKGIIHDHPFGFTTHILKGSYVERVYDIMPMGTVIPRTLHRKAGTSHHVEATCIHEIVELPQGDCYTLIIPEPKVRESGFWKFEDGKAYFRQWNQPDFKLVIPA